MFLPRRLPTRLARHVLALVAAFAQLVAATGAPLPVAPNKPDAPAQRAPAEDAGGSCGLGACCCAPPAGAPACGCCAPAPRGEPVVWIGGTFQQKCHDLPISAGLLKFEFLPAAPECAAVPLRVPGRDFARAAVPALPRTASEPPVPPPKRSVM